MHKEDIAMVCDGQTNLRPQERAIESFQLDIVKSSKRCNITIACNPGDTFPRATINLCMSSLY
ncbi:MAG: hypothetical protein LBF84_01740 [Holosporales bacterium]|jgi:hypothetical protein|nr:hypothetical protein [Holosporales bacterium]